MRALLAALALAGVPQPAQAPDAIVEFGSIEEAAVYALKNAYDISHYYEVGGVLTRLPNGKFAIGLPSTNWSGVAVSIDYDPEDYVGVIVGDYHQHPCNPHNFIPQSFSPQDLLEYRIHHVEGFMLDMCTGKVHAFLPGKDVRTPDDGITEGRIVGRIPVTGVVTDTSTEAE